MTLAVAFIAIGSFAAAQKKVPKKEYDAFMAIQQAPTPDARMEAADKFVENFADSSLKSTALFLAADAAERKNDTAKAITYAQSALDADPKNYEAMLLISGELARTTREHDLDRDDKLAKADKLANDAIAAINTASKPNAQMTDKQWEDYKKERIADAHRDLGMSAFDRNKFDDSIKEFNLALESSKDPTTMIRLAGAYNKAGKPDDAIAVLDKVLAMPDLPAQLKPFAQSEKARAEAAKKK
jgi:tetratricopeptide (TPR) repeat protein